MSALFPKRYAAAELQALYAAEQQQARGVALGRWVQTGAARYERQLAELNAWALDQLAPDIFDEGDPRNVLVAHEREFGAACAALSARGYPNPASLSLFDFQSAVEYLTSQTTPAAAAE